MEYTKNDGKGYAIFLGLVVLGALIYVLNTLNIPTENYINLAILLVIAIVLEAISIEIPYYGYASVAYPIYFFTMLYPYAGRWRAAILIAFVAILLRTLIVNRQPFWFRLKDFVSSCLSITLSAIVFGVVFSKISPMPALQANVTLMSAASSGAAILTPFLISMFASALTYLISDILITTTTAGFLEESYQKIWNEVKNKLRLVSLVYFPFGLTLFLSFSIHPAFCFCIAPVFFILQSQLKSLIQEVVLVEQESLSQSLNTARVELSEIKIENKQINEDLQKKVDEISIVYEMGKALGASVNLEDTYNVILAMVRKLILYQSCVIFLLEKGNLVPAKYATPYKETLAMSPLLQLEETVVNIVVQNRKPMLIPDIQTINEQRIFKDEKCVMCVPLIIKEKIIGVLYVGNTKQGVYTDEQLNILSILANSAAIAIESAQLYEDKEHSLVISKSINNKLEKTVRQLSALNEFGKSLVSSLNMDDTLDFIKNKMSDIIDYQSFIIFTIKDSKDPNADPEILIRRCMGPYSEAFKGANYQSLLEGVLGWVIGQKKPLLLEDTKNSRLPNIVPSERSSIIVPMVVENESIGAFYVGASVPNYYDEEAMNLVSTVTYQTAMAVKNAELYEKMVALAITDGLTGLYTHRYFQERLAETCREYERNLKSFSLIMVDVDHFKTYNDTLGHPEGDKLLQEIAALIKSYTRDSDIVCRYGGDEFAIVLKESDKENSVKIAERIREAFQYKFASYKVKITSSIGVANFPVDSTNKPDLLAAADAALYKSKKGGRNSVNWAVPLVETGGVFIQPEVQAPLPRASEAKQAQPQQQQHLQQQQQQQMQQQLYQQRMQQQVHQIPSGNPQLKRQGHPVQQNNMPTQIPVSQMNAQNMTPQQQLQYQLHLQQQQKILAQQQQIQLNNQQQQLQKQQQQQQQRMQQQRQAIARTFINTESQKNLGEKSDLGATRVLTIKPGVWPPAQKNP